MLSAQNTKLTRPLMNRKLKLNLMSPKNDCQDY